MSTTTTFTSVHPKVASKILPLALALAALAALAALPACGGGGSDGPSRAPTETTASGATATERPPQGTPLPAGRTIDLAETTPKTVIWGADSGDYFNDLPALVTGDVNGDGLGDLLVAARFGDGPGNARQDSGEAYVILGREDPRGVVDLAAGDEDITIYGAALDDQLGFSGALADVNDDGLDDIILGAPFVAREDDRSEAGAVYVVFGGATLPGLIDLQSQPADLLLLGRDGAGFFGDAVAAADVNGDETRDILVGATFARGGTAGSPVAQAGAAYVFFGGGQISGTKDVGKGEFDVAVYGAEYLDELGDNVAGGDLNGDGIADIIMTAEAADGPDNARAVAAEVYIVYGSQDLGGVLSIADGDQDVTIFGAEQNDTIGYNIAAADVTGDGTDDLIMTARLADGPGNSVGEGAEVHIVPGGDIPETIDLAAEPPYPYLYGSHDADLIGNAIGGVDLEGDGARELFVGTGFADGPQDTRHEAGVAYLIDARGLTGAVDVATSPLKLIIYGAHPDDGLGTSIAAGDLDGDGRVELALLAIRSDGPDGARPDAGAIYVVDAAP